MNTSIYVLTPSFYKTGRAIEKAISVSYEKPDRQVVINMGLSSEEYVSSLLKTIKGIGPYTLLNNFQSVHICANKELTLETLSKAGISIPEVTKDAHKALEWEEPIGRLYLKSRGGKGICFKDDIDNFLQCKIYTKYIKKRAEYRIHVIKGKAFDMQQKKLKLTDEKGEPVDKSEVDWRVRTYKNGFIFARNNIEVPQCVITESEKACQAVGLDIGAVDIAYGIDGKPYIFEINSAPGLEGTTLDNYIKELKNVCHNLSE